MRNLRRQYISASRWTAVSSLLRFLLQLAQTMLLARLLAPAEFGLMAVVAAVVGIMAVLADLGMNRAMIHYQDLPPAVTSSLFWLNVGASVLLALLVMTLAPWVAELYGQQQFAPMLVMASLALPISALGSQFRVLAEKELRFRSLARNEIASSAAGLVVAVFAALAGAGVYALIAGALAAAFVSTALAWAWLSGSRRPAFRFCLADVRPYLGFGGYTVGERIANTLRMQADTFIGAMVAAPAALGAYVVPRALSLRLSNAFVNPIASRVSFPVLSRLQGDRPRLKAAYLETLHITSSINFPLYVFLAFFAGDVVRVIYGPQWSEAAYYLLVFSLWCLLRSVGNPVGSLLSAVGRVRRHFFWNIGMLLCVPPVLLVAGRQGGLDAMALALLLIQVGVFPTAWRVLVRPACGAGFGEYARGLVAPLVLSVVAALTAYAATKSLQSAWMRAAGGGLLMALLYTLLSYRYNQAWLSVLKDLARPGAQH